MKSNNLFLLSGMAFCQNQYTPEEWEEKTGVNPLYFFPYIVTNRNNKCFWTAKAESMYQAHRATVTNNWASLGINN